MTLSFYFNYKAELKMNALREREINNNLERRLSEEQKLRGESIDVILHCIGRRDSQQQPVSTVNIH